MKLYKNLVNAIAHTTSEILTNNRYADKAIERLFKQNPQWGSRDRRFIAEAIYDIVRNYRLYSELAHSHNNFWFITSVWLVLKGYEIPPWPEFKHVNPETIQRQKEAMKNIPAVYESYPDWLWTLAAEELGAPVWQKEATAMNEQAAVFIRANTLKSSKEALAAKLLAENVQTENVAGYSDALKLVKRENIFQNKYFKEGFFEVQDAGSQAISVFLDPLPGETIVDACAGAGGKSLHLAALMKNKGRIISLDVEDWKLEELKKRARRAGAFNIETRLIEKTKTIKSLENKADKVLLDVPCSGLGVLKRNPDAKWKLSKAGLDETKHIQEEILDAYSKMLRPKGMLVYSTCSVLPSENREQVEKFLGAHQDFELLSDQTIMPSGGTDGFYMARLHRIK
jgi:16S rRNA (cytosine967-C5)-methyltransferase